MKACSHSDDMSIATPAGISAKPVSAGKWKREQQKINTETESSLSEEREGGETGEKGK